jgi:lysozyme
MANRAILVPVLQAEFDAFVSILFNVGPGVPSIKDGIIVLANGRPSTLLREINARAMTLAAAEFPKWDKIGAVTSQGLLNRRLAEQKIFATGVYVNHV